MGEEGELGVEEGGGTFMQKVCGNLLIGIEQSGCLFQEKGGSGMIGWRGEEMEVVHR